MERHRFGLQPTDEKSYPPSGRASNLVILVVEVPLFLNAVASGGSHYYEIELSSAYIVIDNNISQNRYL